MNQTLSDFGYLRVGVASPALRVADVAYNLEQMSDAVQVARERHCQLLIFPELAITGYTCADLFLQSLLVDAAGSALDELAAIAGQKGVAVVVGVPLAVGDRLFNCAAFLAGGRLRGLVPKQYLPNSQEFYEKRWFAPASLLRQTSVAWRGETVPVGTDLLFQAEGFGACRVGIEICEDAWTVNPPSGRLAAQGATLLVNLSASPETLGKERYRRELVCSQSARCLAVYAYASAGPGESTTDLVFSGHSLIAENGQLLAESERFSFATCLSCADVDLGRMVSERLRSSSFADAAADLPPRLVSFPLLTAPAACFARAVPAMPFVPGENYERAERCREIFALQTTGLAKRLLHTATRQVVIGISGGLDSTLALLVICRAFDRLELPRSGIVAVTMPGFGTTERTRNNAVGLAEQLGVQLRTISIDAAVRQHFADIGHPEGRHDITFENAQARERTQLLMDIANQVGGLVIGTGDLSELALGWCTYNGDHMSMYAVNSGVPKTLVRYLVEWCAEEEFSGRSAEILHDICATPVSPELLPPAANGEIEQRTEEQVGPYLLHDFFLFHALRLQFPPAKILFLAERAFAGNYSPPQLRRWLRLFYQRFFAQQFKRSCLPDGPKVGSVALSPRGDWRMPSDACARLWLEELDRLDGDAGD